ncbi:MAG: hypothetical protein JWM66_414 [Solirubrobacterales bacterium]|jgi:hypothetical protein|nr:hypothetical protein [Solirubrobacterales bacterium]
MTSDPRTASTEKNWRLQAELDAAERGGALEALVGSLRDPPALREIKANVPHDVVITHDGTLLFAYASDAATLQATREAIEAVSARDGLGVAKIRLSHWDTALDDWRHTDPGDESAREQQADAAADADATTVETRTIVASAGNLVREEFERSLLEWARELDVHCTVIEHPHLLAGQVGFTVTGTRRKLDEFADGLKAEERATIRTETAVMLSPL